MWKHGGMWCVNSEMLCLPLMTVVLLCLYFYVLYCFGVVSGLGGHVWGVCVCVCVWSGWGSNAQYY